MSSERSTHRAPEPLRHAAAAVEASLARVAGHRIRFRDTGPASGTTDQYLVSFDVDGSVAWICPADGREVDRIWPP